MEYNEAAFLNGRRHPDTLPSAQAGRMVQLYDQSRHDRDRQFENHWEKFYDCCGVSLCA